MELDADAIERIGAAIQNLRQSGRGDGPLRIYRTRGGELVRVLDDDAAPLTPETLRAIEAYALGGSSASARVETDHDGLNGDDSSALSVQLHTATSEPVEPAILNVATGSFGDSTPPAIPPCDDKTDSEDPTSRHEDVIMEDGTSVPDVIDTIVEEETPSGLDAAGIPVAAWLSGNNERGMEAYKEGGKLLESVHPAQATQDASQRPIPSSDPIEVLMTRWPREIGERTRLCYGATRGYSSPPRCVLYWLRNTYRVSNGNFGLGAAIELAKTHSLPVVALYLSPSSIMYPLRHASGINDAVSRWSIADVRRRLRDDYHIEMFGFTPQDVWSPSETPNGSSLDGGSALYMLLDAFQPAAVVTDDGFSLTSRSELDSLRLFLQNRVPSSWPLLAVDSMTCLPLQSQSEMVRKSLSIETAQYLTEDEFSTEYATLNQHREHFSISIDPRFVTLGFQTSIRPMIKDALNAAVKKVQVQEIMWSVVEGLNAQSANSIPHGSERIGMERLHLLVNATDERPAIQQELQGSGIMSLIPYIRHGTVFSGYVLDKLAAAISSMPRPTDAKSRKAFAMLKVLRSRASSHLAKERDYGLYLSLWATRQIEREIQLSGKTIPFRAISSFKTNVSELDTYKHVLPSWISPNKHVGGASSQAPVYDPYQLESGRTDDQYWNEIQVFLIEKRYVHPLVMVYWAYKILQWSISTRAGIATIEALLDNCCLGSTHSPDAMFIVWTALFHIGKAHSSAPKTAEGAFVSRVEAELATQPRLQFRK